MKSSSRRAAAIVIGVLLVAATGFAAIRWWRSRALDVPRPPQTFRAPRGTAGKTPAPQAAAQRWPKPPPGSGHDIAGGDERARASAARAARLANRDPFTKVADSLAFILQDVATGESGAAERAALEERLQLALERAAWGDAQMRRSAAVRTVTTILDKAAAQPDAGIDRQRAEAIGALAHIMAGELYRDLSLRSLAARDGGVATPAVLPAGRLGLSWRLLAGFDYQKGAPLPQAVRALDGAEVVADGYMITLAETNDIRTFLLVESLWGCCFGKPPELHQGIVVRIVSGPPMEYLFSPIRVSGHLEVGEKRERGVVSSVYRLAATEVAAATL